MEALVEWIKGESFFKLSKWQDNLLEFYDKNPNLSNQNQG